MLVSQLSLSRIQKILNVRYRLSYVIHQTQNQGAISVIMPIKDSETDSEDDEEFKARYRFSPESFDELVKNIRDKFDISDEAQAMRSRGDTLPHIILIFLLM